MNINYTVKKFYCHFGLFLLDMTIQLESKKFKTYTVSLRDDGLIQIEIYPEAEVDLDEVIEGTDYIMSVVKEDKFPVLFIANEFSVPSKESRDYLAKKESLPYSLADAYLIHSFPQKLVGNFYLKVNKPGRPTKIFTDKDEAIAWLKTFQ